jgi:hypothetical protein
MKIYDADFAASLTAARDGQIAPAYFLWVQARDRDTGAVQPVGIWSGDEDISVAVQLPGGSTEARTYYGGCNLDIPDGIPYVADLTDNPVRVSISQIADTDQILVRGYDVRLAYCEIHVTTWTGGALTSAPQLQWVGIIDEAPISTPAAGSDGSIEFSIRSEIMSQLTATNPAKSSDSHQKRRLSTDGFCTYSGTVKSWNIQWFKK